MSFEDMATITISTKRGAITGARRTAPVTYLQNVAALPIMPIDSDTFARVQARIGNRQQAVKMVQTFIQYQAHTKSGAPVTELPDIQEGDRIVDGSNEYTVRDVQSWPTTDLTSYLELFIEEAR